MKLLILSGLALISLSFTCTREAENCKSELTIGSTVTPSTSAISSGITSEIHCYGPDLCYSLSHVDIKGKGNKVYDIRVIANVPCKPSICAQAIYQAKPSIHINTPEAGIYILNFYNRSQLFKSDTVMVN
jgi:hypothetical protein